MEPWGFCLDHAFRLSCKAGAHIMLSIYEASALCLCSKLGETLTLLRALLCDSMIEPTPSHTPPNPTKGQYKAQLKLIRSLFGPSFGWAVCGWAYGNPKIRAMLSSYCTRVAEICSMDEIETNRAKGQGGELIHGSGSGSL